MKINELMEIIQKLPRDEKVKIYKPGPVIHSGFPSCFNLSFAEYELLEEFNGQYLHCDHDFIYSKIQPCIRHQDWNTIISDEENRYRYLSLFEMADISGFMIYQDSARQEHVAKKGIKSFIDFIKLIGLDIKKLNISYFQETSVDIATNGKYKFDFVMPTDPMLEYWKELGIKESQLTPDKTRDTLLSLRIFGLPTPWGYRNEVHYEYKGKLLDIGTVEYMRYEPLFNEKKEICGLKKYQHSLGVSAIGLERINMVLNDMDNVWEVDTIKPLIELFLTLSKTQDQVKAMIATQALRTIHQIVADGGLYIKLNSRRKEYIRMFYKALLSNCKDLGTELNRENLFKLFKLNSDLQPNLNNLPSGIETAIIEVLNRIEAFNNDRSISRTTGKKK